MTATQSHLASLSRFLFTAPQWDRSLGFAVLLAGVTGVAVFDSGTAVEPWLGLLVLGQDAWQGIFFVGIPTVVAVFVTPTVDRAFGGRLTYNHSSLLALACEVVLVVTLVVAGTVAVAFDFGQRFVFDALVLGLASIFAIRLLVIVAISGVGLLTATVPASIQTAVAAVLVFVYSGTVQYHAAGGPLYRAYLVPFLARGASGPPAFQAVTPDHFLLLAVICGLYGTGVWAFLVVFDRPWRRSLGVSALDFIRGFVGYAAEGSRELERFFEALGQEAEVPVTVLSVRARSAIDEEPGDAPEKARVVLPMVHPGPMGEIGGGNLPARIARRAEGLAIPPHATAGHDFNLVSERQVDRVLDAADRAVERLDYAAEATVPVRRSVGEASILGQGFGDDALAVATFAPGSADDVDFGVGLAARNEVRTSGQNDVLFVDAHNSHEGLNGPDLGHVTPGSRRSYDLVESAGLVGDALANADGGELAVGVAWDPTDWSTQEGFGPLGVRVLVTRVVGAETAYVLFDGNNVVPGLRDRLVDALDVDAAEVLTTDTHVVNTIRADNRVGERIDHAALEELVVDLVAEARADCEPVVAGVASERATVTVFGNDRTEALASHANAAVSLGGALAAAVILAAVAVSLLLFLLA